MSETSRGESGTVKPTRATAAVELAPETLERLCATALHAAGADPAAAQAVAAATVAAELREKPTVGVSHLFDYLDALREGRLNGSPVPRLLERRFSSVIVVDADEGAAQVAFDTSLDALVRAAQAHGIASLSIRNCFSAGELAHYTTRTADKGLLALAVTNSPPLLAAYGSKQAVTGTNPFSFALPHPLGARVFDQASSATAWVTVRDAAEAGTPISPGWAIDDQGAPTTDAATALRGALLPFGGAKGANIAMMVDALAALSGASFSIEAAPFDRGAKSPRLGLFLTAIHPEAFDPDYLERAEAHYARLATEQGADFGRRKKRPTVITLASDTYARLTQASADSPSPADTTHTSSKGTTR